MVLLIPFAYRSWKVALHLSAGLHKVASGMECSGEGSTKALEDGAVETGCQTDASNCLGLSSSRNESRVMSDPPLSKF